MASLRTKKWLPLLILLALGGLLYALGTREPLDLATLQAHKDQWLAYRDAHTTSAALLFCAVYLLTVALSLPFATLLTLLGGFLFGKWAGTLLVVAAATAGATIVFLIARSAAAGPLRAKVGPAYSRIEAHMKEDAVSYLLFLRLVPLFPFWLVNIVPALFGVRLRAFVLTTFFGILPGSFIYVNVGEELGDLTDTGNILSPGFLAALTLLGLFAVTPMLYKKLRRKRS